MLATMPLKARQSDSFTFSMASTVPPATDISTIMQRGDEVNTVVRKLTDLYASTVILTGDPGVGKTTLAALLYRRLELTAQAGWPAPKHFVWLSLGAYTTLPDVIASILSALNISEPGFFLLKPEEQVSKLLLALRRPQASVLIVLDQFEGLLHVETQRGLEGRGEISLFLEMLQQDLGVSRVLLTCYRSPYAAQNLQETRVRSFLVSRISLPEGIAILQQRGIQGSYEELSLIWQRCGGHSFALVLFSALFKLSGLSLSYLLNSPDCQSLWSGEVPLQLIAAVYNHLNPVQRTLMRTLSLFNEPVPAQGLFMAIIGENPAANLPLFEQELAFLTQLALVQQSSDKQSVAHFALHSLLRQYIIEHYLEGSSLHPQGKTSTSLGVTGSHSPLNDSQDTREARKVALAAGHMRVAAYYRHMSQEYDLPREKRSKPQDVKFLLAAIHHLCLGWQWQQACDLLLSEAIYENMVQWGAWNTLIGLYVQMLPPNGILTRHDEGLICNHLGLLYDRLGNAQQSWIYYERALAIQHKIGDQYGEALTLTNQGELFRGQGDWQQAFANFEQARIVNRQLCDPLLESVLLHNLGLLHYAAKDVSQALNYYIEALRFARKLPERYNEGMILTNVGILYYEQGYYPEALAVMFYTLKMRQSLQYTTVSYIEQFLTALENNMGLEAFTRLRRAAREVEELVLSQLG